MLNKVENIVVKGEIAHHEQFPLWPQCIQKSSAAIASKCVCRWERINLLPNVVTMLSQVLHCKGIQSGRIRGKGAMVSYWIINQFKKEENTPLLGVGRHVYEYRYLFMFVQRHLCAINSWDVSCLRLSPYTF